MTEDAVAAPHPLAPEDEARANFYALLARLYVDAPDAALLAAIAAAAPLDDPVDLDETAGAERALPAAWDALRAASAAINADVITGEYNDLFVGVGKSEVNLHASHWLAGAMMDKPLIAIRNSLADLGLARRADITLLEDHLAALCETMRILIAGQGGRPPAAIDTQRAFFERHLAPWVFSCCVAIQNCSIANYYRRVAQFTDRYMALERDSFAID